MEVNVIKEAGYNEALLGMALSFFKESEDVEEFWSKEKYARMVKVAKNLSAKGPSHSKFIRQCQLWVMVKAPRFFWSEFDTYKVGTTGLSASTMHTLKKEPLTQEHFEYPISSNYLEELNQSIQEGLDIHYLKNDLPEGYLQTRLINMNYQVLRTIIAQRSSHRLPQWSMFINSVKDQVEYPELLQEIEEE